MDLSHSSRHLPGRLAVLVLRDGDKTPVSAPIGGCVGGWKDRRGMGGALGGGDGFPETLRCFAINFPTHGLKWWWGTILDSVGGRRLSCSGAGDSHRSGNKLNNTCLVFVCVCYFSWVTVKETHKTAPEHQPGCVCEQLLREMYSTGISLTSSKLSAGTAAHDSKCLHNSCQESTFNNTEVFPRHIQTVWWSTRGGTACISRTPPFQILTKYDLGYMMTFICNHGSVNQWGVLSKKNCSYLRINSI